MKTYILIILIVATNLFQSYTYAQITQTNSEQTTDNSFGILELFDGIPLYENRSYTIESVIYSYIPLDEAKALTITKGIDGSSLIIKNGTTFTLTLSENKKTKGFTIKKKFNFENRNVKEVSVKILPDGSVQLFYQRKYFAWQRHMYHFELAGLGLKHTFYRFNKKEATVFLETKEEHKKTNKNYPQTDPRIISLNETAKSRNSIFRFAAAKGDKIEIITTNETNNSSAYLTLYSPDGEIVKETEGKGTLKLLYEISEDNFYYISTNLDSDKDYLDITLRLKN